MSALVFPGNFLWGAATSAYQIEGAVREGGRGESIWDRFVRRPGAVRDGSTGDVACDHVHRFRQDVGLMAEMGLKAYRFSLSWPRILPQGRGPVNQAGLDFYAALVDALRQDGITPMATLYHWDLPQALEDHGGWSNPDVARWFADYANLALRRLGDRVDLWCTLNEPQIFTTMGYMLGKHAPGVRDPGRFFPAMHHANLAHGLAVAAMREENMPVQIGTVLQLPPVHPRSDEADDREAARKMDGLLNRWFAEPVLLGRYPEDMLDLLAPVLPVIHERDLEIIAQPIDFVGLNLYTRLVACHDPGVPLLQARVDERYGVAQGADCTDYGWEVYPQAMYESLLRLRDEWGDPEIYITENGAAYDDPVTSGRVHDQRRIAYLRAYLQQVHRAMQQGVKVRGYFVWSLLDNFEWNQGLTKRFGLVQVDFASGKRIPKDSARFYRELVLSGRLEPEH